MFEELSRAMESVHGVLEGLDPATLDGPGAVAAFDAFCALERMGHAGATLMAARVADSNAWRAEGGRSAADFLAGRAGTSLGAALGMLETSRRLAGCSQTEDALRAGALSGAQADAIAGAAAVDPGAEADLLGAAGTEPLVLLKQRCRRVSAAAATDPVGDYEALRSSRGLRHWSERDGALRIEVRLTPDDGAVVLAALDARRGPIFAEARAAGRRERPEAYAADALVALARGEGSAPSARVDVMVSHAALRRGHLEAGEVCEIRGVGPIPLASAQALLGDCWLRLLVVDGVDITTVAHAGRTVGAHLRSALVARDPVCVVPGCGASLGLEIDHIAPYAAGHPLTYDNAARLCRWHHYLKTHWGYLLGGGPGHWTWSPPASGRHPDDPGDLEDLDADHFEHADDPAGGPGEPHDGDPPSPRGPRAVYGALFEACEQAIAERDGRVRDRGGGHRGGAGGGASVTAA